jgi:hypothetical protein
VIRQRLWIAAAGLAAGLLVFILYWPGLGGSFLFDDETNILVAEGLRMEEISLRSLSDAAAEGHAGPLGRPIAQLSFAFNHYFAGGYSPLAFKATNLSIHLVAGFVVFLLGQRLLSSYFWAGVLAVAWLVHPIQATTILHTVQRMTSLSGLFLFLAMLFYLYARGRKNGTHIGWLLAALGICWPLSLLSKETGVLFPLFAIAWEITIRQERCEGLDRFARRSSWVIFLMIIIAGAFAISTKGQWLWAGYTFRPFTLIERLLTEGRVLWFYLGLILLPRIDAFGLYHDDIQVSRNFIDPWTTIPAWGGLLFVALAAWGLRRRLPLVSFGLLWFLIGHALESTAIPLELAHEHRNYVPSFGILLAVTAAMMRMATGRISVSNIIHTALLATFVYLSLLTVLRAHQFGDDIRRTQIEVQRHPNSARAQYDAGRVLSDLPEAADSIQPIHAFARTHFQRAGENDPWFKLGLFGLIHLRCRATQPVDDAGVEELADRLNRTPFAPGDSAVLYSLKEMSIAGTLCLSRGNVDRLFNAALSNPTTTQHTRAVLHSWRADYYALAVRDLMAAEIDLNRSIELAPNKPTNRLKLVQLTYLQGKLDEARKMLESLRGEAWSRSERETFEQLNNCLAPEDAGKRCELR